MTTRITYEPGDLTGVDESVVQY